MFPHPRFSLPADAPIFPTIVQTVFAAKRGTAGTLTCTAQGAPSVSFVWCRRDDVIGVGSCSAGGRGLAADPSRRYVETKKKLGDDLWASTLTIADVSTDDFGVYVCTASNRLGCGDRGGAAGGAVGRRSAECHKEMTLRPLSK